MDLANQAKRKIVLSDGKIISDSKEVKGQWFGNL
jgi:hypothetical protein